MAYDPNDPNRNFEYDQFSRRPTDPAPAGFSALIIGGIVVLGALIAFLMFRTDPDPTQVGMTPPPITQERPAPNTVTPPAPPPANTPAPAPQQPPANNN